MVRSLAGKPIKLQLKQSRSSSSNDPIIDAGLHRVDDWGESANVDKPCAGAPIIERSERASRDDSSIDNVSQI